jgi:hypothetical protein
MKNEEGYTYLEVIAAICILSISTYLLLSGMNLTVRAADKVMKHGRISKELLLFEYYFRRSVNHIECEYWNRGIALDDFYLFQEDDSLFLDYRKERFQFFNLTLESMNVLDKGIEVIIMSGGKSHYIFARFGFFCLKEDYE